MSAQNIVFSLLILAAMIPLAVTGVIGVAVTVLVPRASELLVVANKVTRGAVHVCHAQCIVDEPIRIVSAKNQQALADAARPKEVEGFTFTTVGSQPDGKGLFCCRGLEIEIFSLAE